ncbi:unnamed protein product [Anisakis simplex]|uniref:Stress-activated protein kinase JNK n=1 Tax=Anisakis simplex TaxID=6269 RepID=A0A0M3JWG0_ANISI|nr:unnamed protein product [Anisakis simplex]
MVVVTESICTISSTKDNVKGAESEIGGTDPILRITDKCDEDRAVKDVEVHLGVIRNRHGDHKLIANFFTISLLSFFRRICARSSVRFIIDKHTLNSVEAMSDDAYANESVMKCVFFKGTTPMSFDANKFHQIRIPVYGGGACTYTVPKRYVNLAFISMGAQGTVVRAEDTITKATVAIKKVQHPFLTPMNAKRTYREFVLLVTMKHPNLIRLINAFSPQTSLRDFEEIYLVMEYMNFNLAEVIQKLQLDQKNLSYFTYQMIVAMKYMHRSGIIHRDLKPSNIVVNNRCILKILDFGLARKMETKEPMSGYVVTRYYRAPEVILGLPYTEKVDVWAIGCILAEMILRKTLFRGIDRLDQWSKITSLLGTGDKAFIDRLDKHARMYVRSRAPVDPTPFDVIFPDEAFTGHFPNAPQLCPKNARDLLSKMLQIDPEKRISIDEAVHHPYVKLWFDESEWNTPLPENRYDPQNDVIERPIEEWRGAHLFKVSELLFNEVKRYEQRHDIHLGIPSPIPTSDTQPSV